MLSTIVLRDPDEACWYQYDSPQQVVSTHVIDEVFTALQQVEHLVESRGWYAAGFVSYEAAQGFNAKLKTHAPGTLPLVCFGLFSGRRRLDSLQGAPDVSTSTWRMLDQPETYQDNVASIRKHIAAGDIYQVNLTTRLRSSARVSFGTFCRIARNAPYAAYIGAQDFEIVSASPELFFQCDQDSVTCRPMKGTAPRGFSVVQDEAQAQWLQHSVKNRAENLMITDMVRNDLGQFAQPGSVHVSALFDVEAYPTVWQMTSTVSARSQVGVSTLFAALFPGASITGAPKRASMNFINELETSAREIYTGAIGMIGPGRVARFNVAIRTAWTDKRSDISLYGAGCGIVWDSDPAAELDELQLKTKVLATNSPTFDLLETMRVTAASGIPLLDEHLARLKASAQYFAFAYDPEALRHQLSTLRVEEDSKLRLTLSHSGLVHLEISGLPEESAIQPVALVPEPVNKNQPWLYHKTTHRAVYEKAAQQVPAHCEAILVNQDGFVTESAIANVVYKMKGTLFTPPVSDGLLPGTLRTKLVSSGALKERSLPVIEIPKVEQWYLLNALRGWRDAELVDPQVDPGG
jgi:para-aminobenzoate synthetase/4-amino-4-deoxychorismate lyase